MIAGNNGASRVGVTVSPGSLSYKPYVAIQGDLSATMTATGGGDGLGWQVTVVIVSGIHGMICTTDNIVCLV